LPRRPTNKLDTPIDQGSAFTAFYLAIAETEGLAFAEAGLGMGAHSRRRDDASSTTAASKSTPMSSSGRSGLSRSIALFAGSDGGAEGGDCFAETITGVVLAKVKSGLSATTEAPIGNSILRRARSWLRRS
jgi:hypothetical protein